jgi:outer membrane immunogenic protein
MIKKILYALAFTSFFGGSAAAADVDPTTEFEWSGPYVGISAGYAFGRNDAFLGADFAGDLPIVERQFGSPEKLNPHGIAGGIYIGYNFDAAPFIFGIEADASLLNAQDSDAQDPAFFSPFINGLKTDIYGIETLRARLGVANGRAFFYGTGGLAVGQIKDSYTFINTDDGFSELISDRKTGVGFALGAGLEYALSDRVSLRAEYLYVNLGTHKFSPDDSRPADSDPTFGVGSGPAQVRIKNAVNIVRAGLSFQF